MTNSIEKWTKDLDTFRKKDLIEPTQVERCSKPFMIRKWKLKWDTILGKIKEIDMKPVLASVWGN